MHAQAVHRAAHARRAGGRACSTARYTASSARPRAWPMPGTEYVSVDRSLRRKNGS